LLGKAVLGNNYKSWKGSWMLSGLKLLNQVSYRARYYKGKPGVTRYIAVFEVE